jgi:hypothetical protein
VKTLQRSWTGQLLPSRRQTRGEEVEHLELPEGAEEDQVNMMVSTLTFIEANLKHSIAALGYSLER